MADLSNMPTTREVYYLTKTQTKNLSPCKANWTKAHKFAKLMQKGIYFPPVKIHYHKGRWTYNDGRNRVMAAKMAGMELHVTSKKRMGGMGHCENERNTFKDQFAGNKTGYEKGLEDIEAIVTDALSGREQMLQSFTVDELEKALDVRKNTELDALLGKKQVLMEQIQDLNSEVKEIEAKLVNIGYHDD